MKHCIYLFLVFICATVHAVDLPDSLKNHQLAPFYYGVASGDPTSDHVILWTHVTPGGTVPINVGWEVATDTGFTNIVSSGVVTTQIGVDYTVKVDAGGLQPNSWYYYRFQYNGATSITGRTRTMPVANINQLRAALFTCADYKDGFFNAYGRVAARNDIDFVIHHGDYIYETNSDENNVRQVYPTADRCTTVAEFRSRYAYYHSDPQLVAACQQYPWFCIWDDHEFRNDAWQEGAVNVSGQAWVDLQANALKAYMEWMPIRFPDANDPLRIYRKYSLGPLADLIMLDARIYGRDEPLPFTNPGIDDSLRTILGHGQRQWLLDQLDSSTAKWKIVSQQVIMAPFRFGTQPAPSSEKAWNGFPYERDFILRHIADSSISNVIITTGDLHASVASDLPVDVSLYNETTGQGSVAVEFVTPSLTNGGSIPLSYAAIKAFNPFLFFGDVINRGYSILDIRQDTVYANYYFTPYLTYSTQQTFEGCRCTATGKSHLQDCSGEALALNAYPLPAPAAPGTVLSIKKLTGTDVLVYPNPASGNIHIIWNENREATLQLLGMNGELILNENIATGGNRFGLRERGIAGGVYLLQIASGGHLYAQKVVVF